jgi:hypothetical protein
MYKIFNRLKINLIHNKATLVLQYFIFYIDSIAQLYVVD